MELFGSGYVIDHCISAYNLYAEEKLYKVYVTDCLKILVGGEFMRYNDIVESLYNHDNKEIESAEEIIERLSARLDELGGGESNVGDVRNQDTDWS